MNPRSVTSVYRHQEMDSARMNRDPSDESKFIPADGQSRSSGPGAWTADGSPVELYRLLKTQGEPEIIGKALPPGASVLELGCGVGRITHPLRKMGFTVVPVDNSPEMLQFVEEPEKVLADIETLDLGREFDAVRIGSFEARFWRRVGDTSIETVSLLSNATIPHGSIPRLSGRSAAFLVSMPIWTRWSGAARWRWWCLS